MKVTIIGSKGLKQFIKWLKVLKNTFIKRCVLCHNLNIGKNRQLCNECKSKEKCKECKSHIPKPPYKLIKFVIFENLN